MLFTALIARATGPRTGPIVRRTASDKRKAKRPAVTMSRLRLAIWALLVTVAAAGADYYKVLTVDKGADEASIKRAYRTLAKCVERSLLPPPCVR